MVWQLCILGHTGLLEHLVKRSIAPLFMGVLLSTGTSLPKSIKIWVCSYKHEITKHSE